MVEVACWAHTRRKFYEAQETDPARAHAAMAMIRLLYDVEAEAKDSPSAERHALRQEQSKPRLEKIKAWLDEQQSEVLPKSPIGQAISYIDKHMGKATDQPAEGSKADTGDSE